MNAVSRLPARGAWPRGLAARFLPCLRPGAPPAPPRGASQGDCSIDGAEPGSGFPAVSDMRQAAKPPITAAAIM